MCSIHEINFGIILGVLLFAITTEDTFSFNSFKFFKLSFNMLDADLLFIVTPLIHFFNDKFISDNS